MKTGATSSAIAENISGLHAHRERLRMLRDDKAEAGDRAAFDALASQLAAIETDISFSEGKHRVAKQRELDELVQAERADAERKSLERGKILAGVLADAERADALMAETAAILLSIRKRTRTIIGLGEPREAATIANRMSRKYLFNSWLCFHSLNDFFEVKHVGASRSRPLVALLSALFGVDG